MDTRPILDRAKTVLFDMLGARLAQPGLLPPIAVLDLFAGSGTLGLEAVSRGARYCLLVEQSRPIAAIIRQNLDHLQAVDEAEVVQADSIRATFKTPPPSADWPDEPREYGLVFVDPPYRMLTGVQPGPHMRDLLARLAYEPVIAKNALILVRHATQGATSPDLSPLVEHERRDVGTMTFRFMVRPGSDL
jgi:16S rRNA (guanine(966)-N(2))-methyltransferase RsmD